MNRKICIVLLCIAAVSSAAQRSGAWCKDVAVPFKALQLPISIRELSFGSEGNESFVRLNIFNQESKAIRHYLILIEFFDRDGNFLLTVPFYTNDDATGESPFPIPYKRWLYGHSNSGVSPIPAFAQKSFFGDSPTVALTCPNSARLAVVQLQYADGTGFSHVAPGLTLDPVIALATISNPTFRQWLPTFLTLKLAIDANGHAQLVTSANPPLSDLLAKEIEDWKMAPALVHGQTAPVEVTLLLYFEDVGQGGAATQLPPEYTSRMWMLEGQGVPVMTMVHAYRWSSAAKKWIVKAGDHWVEKLDERQR